MNGTKSNMAIRLTGLALCTLGVPRAEAVDEEFARSLFLVAQDRASEVKRHDRIVVVYDSTSTFSVEIERRLGGVL